MHLVRFGAPPTSAGDEFINANGFTVYPRALYEFIEDVRGMRFITVHVPGCCDTAFVQEALGRARLWVNADGDAQTFAYWTLDSATTHFSVYRQGFRMLQLPVPPGVDPTHPEDAGVALLLTSDGMTFVERTPDGTTRSWPQLSMTHVELGVRPPTLFIDSPRNALLTVGDDGFRSVPLDGSPEKVLVPTTIDPKTLAIEGDLAYYADASGLWRVPLDGSSAPKLAAAGGARPLLAVGPSALAYSLDPGDRYIEGAGDGWVGGWRFMERGLLPSLSGDHQRLRFLEHAATLDTVGDLTAIPLLGDSPTTLAINAHQFAELPDGRVLAVENHVYEGSWNRLVVIDEAARTKRWVAPSVSQFLLAPDGSDVIADVVTGASGYDILRVPLSP
jgi:hypothetical protein